MNEQELEFIYTIKNKLSADGMRYFYHITDIKNCDSILENGLLMAEKRLSSTTIPIDEEFINNPIKYINEEKSDNRYRVKTGMVLIGCPEEDVEFLVQSNYTNSENWNEEFSAEYIILNDYIVGYIDMNKQQFIDNENYLYYEDCDLKNRY